MTILFRNLKLKLNTKTQLNKYINLNKALKWDIPPSSNAIHY